MKKRTITTDVKVIKTKIIDTLEFRLVFPIKHHNDNSHYINMLDLFVSTTSQKYHNQRDFKKESLKHTILGLGISELTIAETTYIIYSFGLPREGIIKNFNMDESFEFAINALLKPYLDGCAFNAEKFNYEKEFLLSNHMRSLNNIYSANSRKFYDYIDPHDCLGNSYEKSGEVLKQMTPEKLYEFYKKNILENTFIPYAYGNIAVSDAKRLFNKYIPQKETSVTFNTNYFKLLPISKPTYQEEITKYNQSELFLEYQVDIKESETKYLSTLINILNAQENNLIFEALRVKHNLVYDVMLKSFSSRGMFVIIAFIPNDKYKETKKIIKSVFTSLKNKEYLTNCLNKLIKGLEIDLLKEQDGQGKLLNDTVNHDLGIRTTEELLERTASVKVADLIKFIDRVKLTNEMFFRGE